MKINPFLAVLAALMAALIAYALYYYCRSDELVWALTIGGGICIFLPWAATLAVTLGDTARNVNFKVFSAIFAVILTGVQILFVFRNTELPKYLMWSGILLILWLVIAYAMIPKNKKD